MTDLQRLVDELRRELAGELPLRLHQSTGEPMAEGVSGKVLKPKTNGANATGWTGRPFARQFDRYLSGEHGGDFLASDSFAEIRAWCRREHWREQHTGDNPFAWNLCARLAIAAVEMRQPVAFIADAENIDLWLAHNLLTDALRHAAEWRADRRKGVIISDESRLQLDTADTIPVLLAREHRLDEEQRVWELWRAKFPYLRSWESELARRRAFHARYCEGERCILLGAEAA